MKTRVALLTIGQTPRDDLVPDIESYVGDDFELVEFGALDDVSPTALAAAAPSESDMALVTRLRDGSETIVSKPWMERRVQSLIGDISRDRFDAMALLCTGHFPGLRPPVGLFLDAQRIVDAGVGAFLHPGAKLGVIVPLARQMSEVHVVHQPTQFAFASPYSKGRLSEAGAELRDCDVVIMHCIGYTEAMYRTVASVTQKPVLLARRLVGAAIAQLI